MAMNSAKSALTTASPGAIVRPGSLDKYRLNTTGSITGALQGIAGSNTAASAQQAEQLRKWQEAQYETMRRYNSQEAQKNRDWQERMSSTAHQREVRDLIAAGLNPVLSVTGGSGAAVTSGATASSGAPSGAMGSVDNSATGAIAGLFGSLLSSFLSLEGTRVSAQSNQAIADKYTAMSKYTSELQAQTQLNTATISAAAQRYTADAHLAGTKYAADQSAAAQKVAASIHAAAQKYGYDVQSMTQKEIAAFNAEVNKDLQALNRSLISKKLSRIMLGMLLVVLVLRLLRIFKMLIYLGVRASLIILPTCCPVLLLVRMLQRSAKSADD